MPETPIGGHGDRNGTDVELLNHHAEHLPLPDLCAKLHEQVQTFLNAEPSTQRVEDVQKQTRISLEVIDQALSKYSLEQVSISYNGGKDCLVLLILYLAALHAHYAKPVDILNATNNHHLHHSPPARLPTSLNSVYITSDNAFPAVDDFVESSVRHYHLSLSRYAKPMKEAFTDYLAQHPKIKAIFVGTRRTDPHGGKLQHFDPTDRGWPEFMRIHPVIDWHYAEIWTFIRELNIPYCSLYDLGYTSLGGTTDTHPNPALKFHTEDGAGGGGFRPAYELIQDNEERLGRDR